MGLVQRVGEGSFRAGHYPIVRFAPLLDQGGLAFDRLASFCRVAKAGGFTKAARGDPTRQSLFSRQVGELETFFGVQLIRSQGRGISLTDAGRRLYALANEGLAALVDFKQEQAGRPAEIVIGAGESVIEWVLLPRLKALWSSLPRSRVRLMNLRTEAVVGGLREGTVDLADLPSIAADGFDPVQIVSLPVHGFPPVRLALAWNPRTARVRPAVERARMASVDLLRAAAFRACSAPPSPASTPPPAPSRLPPTRPGPRRRA